MAKMNNIISIINGRSNVNFRRHNYFGDILGTVPRFRPSKSLYSSTFQGHFSNLGSTALNLEFCLFKIKIIFFWSEKGDSPLFKAFKNPLFLYIFRHFFKFAVIYGKFLYNRNNNEITNKKIICVFS